MKTRVTIIALFLLLAGITPKVHAQEAEVAAAVRATLDAWKSGRHQAFVDQYHPGARGFFLDGGPLTGGFDVQSLAAAADAGFEADVTLRDLEVQVHGTAAMAAGYLEGTLTLPGGISLPGTWRYTEARTRTPSGWKIVQFHISAMSDGMGL
ncbi:MAG: DUF4440 domain-containing protein [Longimicrobiales bacterium]